MYAVYSCAPSRDGTDEGTTFTSSLTVAEDMAQSLREQGKYAAIYQIAQERTTATTEPTDYAFMRST